ncbi:uncharacterized protein CEXT_508441 [Caerostris extrusa]|uniref:Uncharacterized protein n=1 Tax=Caerostris extrusa TaxID=172846 RepID=A0AAV4WLD7_CAEEX|nr:uncharacterized protein CEXT_508441 [Caerostris extrusa]
MKAQTLNANKLHPSYCKHDDRQRYSAKCLKEYVPKPLPIGCHLKSNDYKLNRIRQNTSNEPKETAFWKKLPYFIQRTGIPERREVKSETNLICNDRIVAQNKVTSFSETHLPFRNSETHYKRISVDDLFQRVTDSSHTRNTNELDIQQQKIKQITYLDQQENLISASDHLKNIKNW